MDYTKLAAELFQMLPAPGKAHREPPVGGMHSYALILTYIGHKEVVLPKDISGIMGVSTARVAVALNDLEEKGLITREIDSDDRRQIIVRLTPKGKEASAEQKEKFLDKMAEFLAELGEDDAREYVRIMGRIAEIMRRKQF